MDVKSILITGSNGFIGSSLISHFKSIPKYHVIGISKGVNRVKGLSETQFFGVDITLQKEVSKIFNLVNPDVVIHCAAISQVDVCESNPELCNKVNVEATAFITTECKKRNTHFIFFSSDFVFDGTLPFVNDNVIPNPISIYGQSKRDSELDIETRLENWAIVRPVLVYGFSLSSARANIFSWVYNSLLEGKTINVVNDQIRTPAFINDVVLLIDELVNSNATGYFNIGGSNTISVFEFAKEVAKISGLNSALIVKENSENVDGAHLRPVHSCFQNQRIQTEFSIKSLNSTQGIEKSLLQIKR